MHRPSRTLRPALERCEGRCLPSRAAGPLRQPGADHPVRPNTPVPPFESAPANATFLDPTDHVLDGDRIGIARGTYVAPFVLLDARGGFISIAGGAIISDNANLIAAATGPTAETPGIVLGNATLIGTGATLRGPSRIGLDPAPGQVTAIGANAIIDGATIEPGAAVSPLARVGPGVTVPGGLRVLPGANVTTDAEASDPARGKVVPLTAADRSEFAVALANASRLATGYTNPYQGNSATGPTNEGAPRGVFNGRLAAVRGISAAPGGTTPTFTCGRRRIHVTNPVPRPRVIGNITFGTPQRLVHRLGRGTSIRSDEGQAMAIASISSTGERSTIHNPPATRLTVGRRLALGSGAVLLGGPSAVLGDDVTIGDGAVVARASIGPGASIGARSYLLSSTIPGGAAIPPGTILVDNRVLGTIQWCEGPCGEAPLPRDRNTAPEAGSWRRAAEPPQPTPPPRQSSGSSQMFRYWTGLPWS